MRRTDGRSVLQLYQHMRHFLGLIRRSENDTGSLVCAACWGSCFFSATVTLAAAVQEQCSESTHILGHIIQLTTA
jgi:hypothetical protein